MKKFGQTITKMKLKIKNASMEDKITATTVVLVTILIIIFTHLFFEIAPFFEGSNVSEENVAIIGLAFTMLKNLIIFYILNFLFSILGAKFTQANTFLNYFSKKVLEMCIQSLGAIIVSGIIALSAFIAINSI